MHDKGIEKIVNHLREALGAIENDGIDGLQDAVSALQKARESIDDIEDGATELLIEEMSVENALSVRLKNIEKICRSHFPDNKPDLPLGAPKIDLAEIVKKIKAIEEELISIERQLREIKENIGS